MADQYISVNGIARKTKAGYIGVNGIARSFTIDLSSSIKLVCDLSSMRTQDPNAQSIDLPIAGIGTGTYLIFIANGPHSSVPVYYVGILNHGACTRLTGKNETFEVLVADQNTLRISNDYVSEKICQIVKIT